MDGGRRLGAFPRSPRSFIRKCRRRSRSGATAIRLFTGAVVSRARCASSRALATRTRKPALASRRESPSSFATRLSASSITVVYVRLHENGCYVPCDEAEAGGFCIKTAIDRKDEETGETTTYLEDFVYAFADGGLLGIEPVGSVENVSGTLMLAENDKVLDILLGGAAE